MHLNPAYSFVWVRARGKAVFTIPGILYSVMVFLSLLFIQPSHAVSTAFLRGPRTDRSNGCSLCEQCGGNESTTMPLNLQKSSAYIRIYGIYDCQAEVELWAQGKHWYIYHELYLLQPSHLLNLLTMLLMIFLPRLSILQ